jgi:hypothetical protein
MVESRAGSEEQSMTSGKWSTVSLVKDTQENVRRFVSWHLALGADHMYLFFDDPHDPSIEMLRDVERVTAVACSGAFWQDILGKSVINRHGRRQNSATTYGYRQVRDGWVVNLDCDEFLYGQDLDLAGWLAMQPGEVNVIRVRPAERILPDGEAGAERFRLPADAATLQDVYREFAPVMAGRGGFFGHVDGKSIIRAGLDDISLRQHWPQRANQGRLVDLDVGASPDFCLLHRNAETYENWRRKLEFRLDSVSIPGPLRTYLYNVLTQETEEQLKDAHRRIFHLSHEACDSLARRGRLLALRQPLNSYASRVFDGRSE